MTRKPPREGWLKCNMDAAFNKHCGITNKGWCVRDNLRNFIIVGVAWGPGTLSVIEVEPLALKEAINGAIRLHMKNVIFESDSQRAVHDIHSNHNGGSEFNFIINSIKALLSVYPNFEVKFIKRQAKMVAHSLAKAIKSWSRRITFNSTPSYIEQVLINKLH
ncbi:unnamed protein product [Lathyrus oleraceus]